MFNLFKKKKTHIGKYFEHFSKEKREAVVAALTLIGVIDGDSDKKNFELLYTAFYAKELQVDGSKITTEVRKKGIINILQPLLTCTNAEKAILCFIFRGMANIDEVANDKELEMISVITEKLNFDLDKWYAGKASENELNEVNLFLKGVIFPNGNTDVEQGGGIINHLAASKVDDQTAQQAFIKLAVGFELAKEWSIDTLEDQISSLDDVYFSDENTDQLRRFFRGRIIQRMQNAIK